MPSGTGSDSRFRLAVEASPAAMIMTGPDGLIEFANAETERMFHYSVEELIGRSIDELVPQRMRGAHAGLRRGFLASPSKRPMGAGRDLNGVRKDWMEFPVEIALTPIDSENDLIVLSTVVDITARRRSETELAQRASELELANERLTQFAYVASHDLQEPLRKNRGLRGPSGRSDRKIRCGRRRPRHFSHRVFGGPRPPAGRQPAHLLARDGERNAV